MYPKELQQKLNSAITTLMVACGNAGSMGMMVGLHPTVSSAKTALLDLLPTLIEADPPPKHLDDHAVDAFAKRMQNKLRKARDDGRGGWNDKNAVLHVQLVNQLIDHINKGDPVDVANFCMFLSERGESTRISYNDAELPVMRGSDIQLMLAQEGMAVELYMLCKGPRQKPWTKLAEVDRATWRGRAMSGWAPAAKKPKDAPVKKRPVARVDATGRRS
jgi:hypothetical protein